jgi:hypothetical protein
MSTPSTPRLTAAKHEGRHWDRDDFDEDLWGRLQAGKGEQRSVEMSEAEAKVVIDLLEELAALYPERLGRTANQMGVRLQERIDALHPDKEV